MIMNTERVTETRWGSCLSERRTEQLRNISVKITSSRAYSELKAYTDIYVNTQQILFNTILFYFVLNNICCVLT